MLPQSTYPDYVSLSHGNLLCDNHADLLTEGLERGMSVGNRGAGRGHVCR